MKIAGFQKLTLIDYPGKIACTLFLSGCNFRCGFCHNPEIVLSEPEQVYPENEILEFLKKRKLQLEGVCITGGEPLLSLDIDFLKEIRKLGYLIKIDTNGSYPEKLQELMNLNLVDFVSMDIKSSKEKYKELTNVDVDLDKIEKSIRLISNLEDYEFRTTIIEGMHDLEEIREMAVWLNKLTNKKPQRFCLQGFKNQESLLDPIFRNKKDTSREFLEQLKASIKDYFEEIDIRM